MNRGIDNGNDLPADLLTVSTIVLLLLLLLASLYMHMCRHSMKIFEKNNLKFLGWVTWQKHSSTQKEKDGLLKKEGNTRVNIDDGSS